MGEEGRVCVTKWKSDRFPSIHKALTAKNTLCLGSTVSEGRREEGGFL